MYEAVYAHWLTLFRRVPSALSLADLWNLSTPVTSCFPTAIAERFLRMQPVGHSDLQAHFFHQCAHASSRTMMRHLSSQVKVNDGRRHYVQALCLHLHRHKLIKSKIVLQYTLTLRSVSGSSNVTRKINNTHLDLSKTYLGVSYIYQQCQRQ